MFIRLGAELSNPEREIIMSKSAQTLQTFRAYPAPTHPLLVFPLLGHLVTEVGQLRGQLLHQLLRLVELQQQGVSIKGSYFYTILSCRHHPPAPAASSTRSAPRPRPRPPGRWRAASGTSPDTCPKQQLFFIFHHLYILLCLIMST